MAACWEGTPNSVPRQQANSIPDGRGEIQKTRGKGKNSPGQNEWEHVYNRGRDRRPPETSQILQPPPSENEAEHPVQACKIQARVCFFQKAEEPCRWHFVCLPPFAAERLFRFRPKTEERGIVPQQLKPRLVHGVCLTALYLAEGPGSQNEAFIRLLRSEGTEQEPPCGQTGCHQQPPRITIPLRGSLQSFNRSLGSMPDQRSPVMQRPEPRLWELLGSGNGKGDGNGSSL